MTISRNQFFSNLNLYTSMINDRWRNEFFYNALNKYAKDKVVLDVGSGTGILSFYALEAGAKFVYAVDINPNSAALTREVLASYFDENKFCVLEVNFWTDELDKVKFDHEVDILVTETVGPGLFDQGMFHTLHCAAPYLAQDVIVIPDTMSVDLWIYPNKRLPSKEEENFHLAASKMISKNFAKSLIDISSHSPTTDNYFWTEINKIEQQPEIKIENICKYSRQSMPQFIPSDDGYPAHITPIIKFEQDIQSPCSVAFINKISFESATLYLKDASLMPWKFAPVLWIGEPGRYEFVYSNPNFENFYYTAMGKNGWTWKKL